MARKAKEGDKPDAITFREDDGNWHTTCLLCPRTLSKESPYRNTVYMAAVQHLLYSHGLKRIWVDEHPHGYKQLVQDSLPLIVTHNLQTLDHVRPH